MTNKTIHYYNTHAADFVAGTENADMQACRERFLRYLKPGQSILDAGCGSGRDVIAFRNAGYVVDAFDASAEICRIASEKTGMKVKQLRFEELEGEEQYDAIWCCASLLHVDPEDLPDVLTRLHRLLKPEGILFACFKYGSGVRVKDGRFFHDLTEDECVRLLTQAGFSMKELFITRDVRSGREEEKWVNAIAEKKKARETTMKKRKIDALACSKEIAEALEKGVFLTTKNGDKINSMVIGWGHIGRIWERPVFVAYVRECRYTREMLDVNPEFTVNVPINGFSKQAFAICGSKSGRDMDKIKEAGLTPVEPEVISVPAIKEFPLTLECRVIYREEQDAARLPEEIRRQFYSIETKEHISYYGEIVAVYVIEE